MIDAFRKNSENFWTSVYLYDKYVEQGGITLSRNGAVDGMKSYFSNKILVFSAPGLARIVIFWS